MYSKEKAIKYAVENGLDTKSRKQSITDKRHYLMKYFRYVHKMSFDEIGRIFNRDHSTVVHAIKKYEYMQHDAIFLHHVEYEMYLFPLIEGFSINDDFVDLMEITTSLVLMQDKINKQYGKRI